MAAPWAFTLWACRSAVAAPPRHALPPQVMHAGVSEYWEEYYQGSPVEYDWFRKYTQPAKEGGASLRDVFRKHLRPTDRILNVGAGMSMLSLEMWRDGFLSIDNIDISVTAMDTMRGLPGVNETNMTFQAMDCRNMSIPSGSYDVVVDKGLLDVLTGSPKDEDLPAVASEVHRVLTPSGRYIFVSFAPPDRRLPKVEHLQWGCTHEKVGKPFINQFTQHPDDYVYICDKSAPRSSSATATESNEL